MFAHRRTQHQRMQVLGHTTPACGLRQWTYGETSSTHTKPWSVVAPFICTMYISDQLDRTMSSWSSLHRAKTQPKGRTPPLRVRSGSIRMHQIWRCSGAARCVGQSVQSRQEPYARASHSSCLRRALTDAIRPLVELRISFQALAPSRRYSCERRHNALQPNPCSCMLLPVPELMLGNKPALRLSNDCRQSSASPRRIAWKT